MSSLNGRKPHRNTRSLRQRLEEAEETIRAIRDAEVDAFVMRAAERDQVIPLEPADRPYRLLVERMQQAAMTVAGDGTILYCNQRFAQLLDCAMEAVFGQPFADWIDASYLPVWDALQRQAATEGSSQGEISLRRKDGRSVPTYAALAPFGQNLLGLSVMLTDLTAQKRHEAIVAAEGLSRSILEQAADAIIVCDAAGRVIRASRAAVELCGRNPLLQPFGASFALFSAEKGSVGAQPLDLDAVLRGETVRNQEVVLRQPAQHVDLLFRAGPLRREGTIIGCVVTLTDISERKRTEEALHEADRRKDEFLAVLGHELRNALGPIRNASEILNRLGLKRRTAQQAQEMIARQISHMTRLIDDLLDVSRIESGKILLRRERVDLIAVLRGALQNTRKTFETAGLTIEAHLPDEPLWVAGDGTRLAQIFGNILDNAGKFTDPGGRIIVLAEREAEGTARVSIADTGIGMDRETLERVFDQFSQAERSLERSRGGLGLGMPLARGLVELHGGSIEAQSPGPGRGSEFTVRLPLEKETAALSEASEPQPRPQKLYRVLIVEDSSDMADSLRLLLELTGHVVAQASEGRTGVETARDFRPEIVLCDLGLPGGMDGYAVARELRKDPVTASAYLIALSGYAGDDDQRRAREAGFDIHVSKPISFDRLERLFPPPPRDDRPRF